MLSACQMTTIVMAKNMKISLVADLDPGPGAYLTPGSGVSFSRIPDLRSGIPNPQLMFLRA